MALGRVTGRLAGLVRFLDSRADILPESMDESMHVCP